MGENGVNHGAEDDNADDDANPQAHVVQVLDALAHVGNAGAQIQHDGQGIFGKQQQSGGRQTVFKPAGERS